MAARAACTRQRLHRAQEPLRVRARSRAPGRRRAELADPFRRRGLQPGEEFPAGYRTSSTQARGARTRAQGHLVFPQPSTCVNRGAVPLDRSRRPRRPVAGVKELDPSSGERVQGDPRRPGRRPEVCPSVPVTRSMVLMEHPSTRSFKTSSALATSVYMPPSGLL